MMNKKSTFCVQVYYEDTDCGGVVYYANYLHFLERARTQFFQDYGFSLKQLREDGIQFAVKDITVSYRSPAFYGDILLIETELTKQIFTAVSFAHIVKHKDSGKVLMCADSTLVCISNTWRPIRIPEEIVKAFKKS